MSLIYFSIYILFLIQTLIRNCSEIPDMCIFYVTVNMNKIDIMSNIEYSPLTSESLLILQHYDMFLFKEVTHDNLRKLTL